MKKVVVKARSKQAVAQAAAVNVSDKLTPAEQADVVVQRTGVSSKQAAKAIKTVKANESFRTDPRFNFEERVQRLMKKGDSRADAEATVSRVIRSKELPQAAVTPGQEVRLETLVAGQHFHTNTKDAQAARKMGHVAETRQGYVVFQGAGSVLVSVNKTELRMAPDMIVMALDKVEDLTLLSSAKAVSSSGSHTAYKQMEEVMAKGKEAKVKVAAKKAETKANGAAKETKEERVSKLEAQTVTLLKMPENGALKGQALVILEALKSFKKGTTVANLIASLEGKVTTKNVLGLKDVWNMNRPKLLTGGYISVA